MAVGRLSTSGRVAATFNEGNKLGGISQNLTAAATGTGTPLAAPVTGNASTMSPYLGMNYCIALEGIYPSRD